ncbi:hypothetical protein DSN97_07310 [Deferribacteraceae bacterium V6Fe1]|nr:hypothetical protein DSN97_07310 [Deferribacteraceae bacterium V6Fe1]
MNKFSKDEHDFYLNNEKKIKSESYVYNFNSYDLIPELLDTSENHIDGNNINSLEIYELQHIEDFYIKNVFLNESLIDDYYSISELDLAPIEEYEDIQEYHFFRYEVDLYAPEYDKIGVDEFIEAICDLFAFGLDEYYQLYNIFEGKESIHYKTKEVIFNFLKENCTVSEIVLAYQIRQLWVNNTNFHYECNKYKNDFCFEKRPNISWRVSMKMVKCFNSLPSIDEIELMLDELYSIWIESYFKIYRFFYDFLSAFFDNQLFKLTASPMSLCEIDKSFWENYCE